MDFVPIKAGRLAPGTRPEELVPQIVVRTEDSGADIVEEMSRRSSPAQEPAQQLVSPGVPSPAVPPPPRLAGLTESRRAPSGSSMSAQSDESELSPPPFTPSSKATTPVDGDSPGEAPAQPGRPPVSVVTPRSASEWRGAFRPKLSIPPELPLQEYATQCIAAAESSRLNPYALHEEEYLMLRCHISHAQATTYLNIRNGILRLWVRNPQIAVTREEAVGCAKDARWTDVASVCFDWLARRGYINFGCVKIDPHVEADGKPRPPGGRRRRVVVVGAGMAGLGCARQLEGLFIQYADRFHGLGEEPPEVVVLEGRERIGGRIYSRPLRSKPASPPPSFAGARHTAEMGGMIVTGFERGNPLNILVRGQLGLPYHILRSETPIYDTNGKPVDAGRDQLVERLYNDCLDRVSEYKFKQPPSKSIEGNRGLVDEGRDSSAEVHKTIAHVEETTAAQPYAPPISALNVAPPVNLVPVSSDRVTGRVLVEPGTPTTVRASQKAKAMGWPPKAGSVREDIDLSIPAKPPGATLGSVLDSAISQYKDIVDLHPQDLRLINWHIANLEYSNATNLHNLSLQGWDIDAGNEWEGRHTMIVGGYQRVPRGLLLCPRPLDLRQQSPVKQIRYSRDGTGQALVECEDGSTIEADYVVNTIPLGVLKHGSVGFEPALPSWKTDAIGRLGFGVLNKVILVYEEAFWNEERDIFGVLRSPPNRHSSNQADYSARRGRFFQWFNVSNTSGLPALVAFMAGDAGFDTEKTCNDDLLEEATEVLRSVFGPSVPRPKEIVVTRWASDKFARGSYSSAGPSMRADDYDAMARPVGNLLFAGEHTCGTHPATVHGAYLSGLRVASEVLDSLLGPIQVPAPLIPPRGPPSSHLQPSHPAAAAPKDPARARLEAHEAAVWDHLVATLGPPPARPAKPAASAYHFFLRVRAEDARQRCEEGRGRGRGRRGRVGAKEVRMAAARMWRECAAAERRPFEALAEEAKAANAEAARRFAEAAAAWDARAAEARRGYEAEHPFVPGPSGEGSGAETEAGRRRRRRRRMAVASYAESEGSDVEMGL